MSARYRHHYAEFGARVLRSPALEAALRARAERVKAQFVATAPVGAPYEGDDHPGRFRDSAVVSSGVDGGPHHDRAFGRVTVTDPAALSIEFGHHPERGPGGRFARRGTGAPSAFIPGSFTLTAALDAAGGL